MTPITRSVALASILALAACTQPAAQSQQEVEALRKELEALKKDVAEIRDFLKQATGGRFGAARLEDQSIDLKGAPVKGQASAPLTMVEISDYHCPFCRRHFQETQPRIDSEFVWPGKVRHVFVHMPIDQLHPEAFRSHEGAACAAEQGKFWELHAKLFERPSRTSEEIVALGQAAGLNASALKGCIDNGKYSSAVRESVATMRKLSIDSTPMFLIGKTPPSGQPMKILKVVRGAHPYDTFKEAFESLK